MYRDYRPGLDVNYTCLALFSETEVVIGTDPSTGDTIRNVFFLHSWIKSIT